MSLKIQLNTYDARLEVLSHKFLQYCIHFLVNLRSIHCVVYLSRWFITEILFILLFASLSETTKGIELR